MGNVDSKQSELLDKLRPFRSVQDSEDVGWTALLEGFLSLPWDATSQSESAIRTEVYTILMEILKRQTRRKNGDGICLLLKAFERLMTCSSIYEHNAHALSMNVFVELSRMHSPEVLERVCRFCLRVVEQRCGKYDEVAETQSRQTFFNEGGYETLAGIFGLSENFKETFGSELIQIVELLLRIFEVCLVSRPSATPTEALDRILQLLSPITGYIVQLLQNRNARIRLRAARLLRTIVLESTLSRWRSVQSDILNSGSFLWLLRDALATSAAGGVDDDVMAKLKGVSRDLLALACENSESGMRVLQSAIPAGIVEAARLEKGSAAFATSAMSAILADTPGLISVDGSARSLSRATKWRNNDDEDGEDGDEDDSSNTSTDSVPDLGLPITKPSENEFSLRSTVASLPSRAKHSKFACFNALFSHSTALAADQSNTGSLPVKETLKLSLDWDYIFDLLMMDECKLPTVVWSRQSRAELLGTLSREMEDIVCAQSADPEVESDIDRALENALSFSRSEACWSYEDFQVSYTSLDDYLYVQPYYVQFLSSALKSDSHFRMRSPEQFVARLYHKFGILPPTDIASHSAILECMDGVVSAFPSIHVDDDLVAFLLSQLHPDVAANYWFPVLRMLRKLCRSVESVKLLVRQRGVPTLLSLLAFVAEAGTTGRTAEGPLSMVPVLDAGDDRDVLTPYDMVFFSVVYLLQDLSLHLRVRRSLMVAQHFEQLVYSLLWLSDRRAHRTLNLIATTLPCNPSFHSTLHEYGFVLLLLHFMWDPVCAQLCADMLFKYGHLQLAGKERNTAYLSVLLPAPLVKVLSPRVSADSSAFSTSFNAQVAKADMLWTPQMRSTLRQFLDTVLDEWREAMRGDGKTPTMSVRATLADHFGNIVTEPPNYPDLDQMLEVGGVYVRVLLAGFDLDSVPDLEYFHDMLIQGIEARVHATLKSDHLDETWEGAAAADHCIAERRHSIMEIVDMLRVLSRWYASADVSTTLPSRKVPSPDLLIELVERLLQVPLVGIDDEGSRARVHVILRVFEVLYSMVCTSRSVNVPHAFDAVNVANRLTGMATRLFTTLGTGESAIAEFVIVPSLACISKLPGEVLGEANPRSIRALVAASLCAMLTLGAEEREATASDVLRRLSRAVCGLLFAFVNASDDLHPMFHNAYVIAATILLLLKSLSPAHEAVCFDFEWSQERIRNPTSEWAHLLDLPSAFSPPSPSLTADSTTMDEHLDSHVRVLRVDDRYSQSTACLYSYLLQQCARSTAVEAVLSRLLTPGMVIALRDSPVQFVDVLLNGADTAVVLWNTIMRETLTDVLSGLLDVEPSTMPSLLESASGPEVEAARKKLLEFEHDDTQAALNVNGIFIHAFNREPRFPLAGIGPLVSALVEKLTELCSVLKEDIVTAAHIVHEKRDGDETTSLVPEHSDWSDTCEIFLALSNALVFQFDEPVADILLKSSPNLIFIMNFLCTSACQSLMHAGESNYPGNVLPSEDLARGLLESACRCFAMLSQSTIANLSSILVALFPLFVELFVLTDSGKLRDGLQIPIYVTRGPSPKLADNGESKTISLYAFLFEVLSTLLLLHEDAIMFVRNSGLIVWIIHVVLTSSSEPERREGARVIGACVRHPKHRSNLLKLFEVLFSSGFESVLLDAYDNPYALLRAYVRDMESPLLLWNDTARAETLASLEAELHDIREKLDIARGFLRPERVEVPTYLSQSKLFELFVVTHRWDFNGLTKRWKRPSLEKEFRVGKVYIRCFLSNPSASIGEPEYFLSKLLRRVDKAIKHVRTMFGGESVSKIDHETSELVGLLWSALCALLHQYPALRESHLVQSSLVGVLDKYVDARFVQSLDDTWATAVASSIAGVYTDMLTVDVCKQSLIDSHLAAHMTDVWMCIPGAVPDIANLFATMVRCSDRVAEKLCNWGVLNLCILQLLRTEFDPSDSASAACATLLLQCISSSRTVRLDFADKLFPPPFQFHWTDSSRDFLVFAQQDHSHSEGQDEGGSEDAVEVRCALMEDPREWTADIRSVLRRELEASRKAIAVGSFVDKNPWESAADVEGISAAVYSGGTR